MNAYGIISEQCKRLGIEEFGVTTAKRHDTADIESVICVLFPYKRSGAANARKPQDGKIYGKIVSGDVFLGQDYHIYAKETLGKLCEALRSSIGGEYEAFCDTGPLDDRALAVRSGLCKYGRNSLAINKRYGTYFFIGYILTSIAIENSMDCDARLSESCSVCRKCVDACPSGALSMDKPFERAKCVSHISQKKGTLSDEETRLLGDTLYGCHICQNVCPQNGGTVFVKYVDIDEILNLSNREFKKHFNDTAAGWIGRNKSVRNALAVVANSTKEG